MQLVDDKQPVGVGTMVLPRAVLVARFVGVIGLGGGAILVAMLPDRPGAAVGGGGRAGFVMNHAILHPPDDRFDRATKEEGDESDNRTHAAGTGATGQHPLILAEEEAKR